MATLGNTPAEETVLRLMARKSFALGLWIRDQNDNPLDIAGVTIRMVVRRKRFVATDDSDNLLVNSQADIVAPLEGYAKFSLQASELNYAPGEYLFSIVLEDEGYSSVIVQGTIELDQNTEFSSTNSSYSESGVASALRVLLREQTALVVHTGPTLAPGTSTFTNDMERKLLEIFAGKLAAGETLNADSIPDGILKVLMTIDERNKLANLTLQWDDILGKPTFGTIISHNTEDFVPTGGGAASDIVSGVFNKARIPKVSGLDGFTSGPGAPSGGAPGDLYFRYTP